MGINKAIYHPGKLIKTELKKERTVLMPMKASLKNITVYLRELRIHPYRAVGSRVLELNRIHEKVAADIASLLFYATQHVGYLFRDYKTSLFG